MGNVKHSNTSLRLSSRIEVCDLQCNDWTSNSSTSAWK